MKIRYHAWLRDSVGCAGEEVALPAGVTDVGRLLDWMSTRGKRYEEAFELIAVVMVLVNGRNAGRNHPVCDGDEIQFVPPIAGG